MMKILLSEVVLLLQEVIISPWLKKWLGNISKSSTMVRNVTTLRRMISTTRIRIRVATPLCMWQLARVLTLSTRSTTTQGSSRCKSKFSNSREPSHLQWVRTAWCRDSRERWWMNQEEGLHSTKSNLKCLTRWRTKETIMTDWWMEFLMAMIRKIRYSPGNWCLND